MPDPPGSKIDTSSSSTEKKTELTLEDEDEDDQPRKSAPKAGLRMSQLKAFGFNTTEELARNRAHAAAHAAVDDGAPTATAGAGQIKAAAVKKARSKNKTQTVVYGADPDDIDDDDFHDQDYDNDLNYPDAVDDDDDDDSDEDDEGQDEAQAHDVNDEAQADDLVDASDGEEEGEMVGGRSRWTMDEDVEGYYDDDEYWEDEEDDLDEEDMELQRQEAYEAAVIAAEEEKERIRDLRVAEIMKKKEILIERYLRVARVMINHRKKNIFLQDYLYHLAFRKGVLRGDTTQMHNAGQDMDEESTDGWMAKANRRRQQRKNVLMASRFARFLRKTGHFYDEDQGDAGAHSKNRHHRHREPGHHHHNNRRFGEQNKSRHNFNAHRSQFQYLNKSNQDHHHHHHRHKNRVPTTAIRKNSPTCQETQDGKACPLNKKTRAKIRNLQRKHKHPYRKSSRNWSRSVITSKQKPRNLAEILEAKAAATANRALKHADEALEAFEKHRCKMAKKKQLIKIAKLLERQYSGISLLEQERNHLVSFVETSVKAQNLAKKKALKRQQRNKSQNKTGVVNFNHQWTKSLERIRELRLKKAKLEQEHRLVLLRKVKHWHIWEKRDTTAIDTVYDFVTNMASKVNMTKRETDSFNQGIEHFHKQLNVLHETMLEQVVKMFKAQTLLCMAQRQAKDNTSVAAPMMKGFTMSDFERMSIENHESHQKLLERQEHLVEQYEKLKIYIKQVADSHLRKQRSWGALRTGRHDMKQLVQLCFNERDNLLKKLQEIRKVKRLHQRLFMQISVLENKHLFKDFRKVNARVQELSDIERTLQTQLHQAQSALRVLNVRYADTQDRDKAAEKEHSEKVTKEHLRYSQETIETRFCPRIPDTLYNVNMASKKSQENILERQKRNVRAPSTAEENKRKSSTLKKNQLPRITN